MKTIGFPISLKENEKRRVLLPRDIESMKNSESLYFEQGYGEVLGITDQTYLDVGCQVVRRAEVLMQDIICDPKVGDAEYLEQLNKNQTIFGWIHATQNKNITDKIVKQELTAYAWENMFYKGRHVFWNNNELAGEASVMHAFLSHGCLPYKAKVAVVGRGNAARGAIKMLNNLGASVHQYNRHMEEILREEIKNYDVIVNCVLWDVNRTDHIIYKEDLFKMKRGSMIIDVSCDRNGGIETSVPTSISNPTYEVNGVTHYVVDHTPSLFYKTFTSETSNIIYPFLEELITETNGEVLKNALIIEKGVIIDKEIIEYQSR